MKYLVGSLRLFIFLGSLLFWVALIFIASIIAGDYGILGGSNAQASQFQGKLIIGLSLVMILISFLILKKKYFNIAVPLILIAELATIFMWARGGTDYRDLNLALFHFFILLILGGAYLLLNKKLNSGSNIAY